MLAVTVMTAIVMKIIGCVSAQLQLSALASPKLQEFLFQVKAEAKEGQVNTSIKLKGLVEVMKEAGSGLVRAQWCEN